MTKAITEIIKQRFSCRTYQGRPIEENIRAGLENAIAAETTGPLGTPLRFKLTSDTMQNGQALKGLTTYGMIKNPSGFIVGAAAGAARNLEDYGFALERIILYATDLGLGTCWLGGTFSRSSFARSIGLSPNEELPAVVSVGYCIDPGQARNAFFRRMVGSKNRLAWENLFYENNFDAPLAREAAGPYSEALDMVRAGPSASNKQPWRIVKHGPLWHFYLKRTKGYGGIAKKLLKLADIQRVDIGIAMCHFQLTAQEFGLKGAWRVQAPAITVPEDLTEYIVTWET
jgi:nitroreductase